MKKLLVLTLLSISTITLKAQTYEFLNDSLVFSRENNIYLKNKYLSSKNTSSIEHFNEYNLKEWWYPMTFDSISMPSIKPFLKSFDFNHLRADIIANRNDTIIDFKKLNDVFIPVTDDYINKYPKNTYIQISKPYFNCSKDWVILFIDVGNRYYDYGNGYIYVYRKIKNEWQLYHKIELWIS
jgi:hypothetical protein